MFFYYKYIDKKLQNEKKTFNKMLKLSVTRNHSMCYVAESGGLLRKERMFFEAKSVYSFNAKISRQPRRFLSKKGAQVCAPYLLFQALLRNNPKPHFPIYSAIIIPSLFLINKSPFKRSSFSAFCGTTMCPTSSRFINLLPFGILTCIIWFMFFKFKNG